MRDRAFADLLTERLGKEKRTGAWLATELGIHRATVGSWINEGVRPRDPETVKAIARLLNMTAEERKALFLAAFPLLSYVDEADDEASLASSEPSLPLPPTAPGFRERIFTLGDPFFKWSSAPEHMRSSWEGMMLYSLGAVTDQWTAQGFLRLLVSLILWGATYWFMEAVLIWPMGNEATRQIAFVKAGVGTLLVPLIVASFIRADREGEFKVNTRGGRLRLWVLKVAGALVGFYVFAMLAIGVALLWHYAWQPALPGIARAMMLLVPLVFSYVAARRIPTDRFKMFDEIRLDPADRMVLAAFTLAGPGTFLFLHFSYEMLVERHLGLALIVVALLLVTLRESRQQRAKG